MNSPIQSTPRGFSSRQQSILTHYMERPGTIAYMSLGEWFALAHQAREVKEGHATLSHTFEALKGISSVVWALKTIANLRWDEYPFDALIDFNKANSDF